jgi:hypothetical protein
VEKQGQDTHVPVTAGPMALETDGALSKTRIDWEHVLGQVDSRTEWPSDLTPSSKTDQTRQTRRLRREAGTDGPGQAQAPRNTAPTAGLFRLGTDRHGNGVSCTVLYLAG